MKRFEEDFRFDIVLPDQFVEELKNKNIYDKIVDIINKDENFKSITRFTNNYFFLNDSYDSFGDYDLENVTDSEEKKKIIHEKMNGRFKELYTDCSKF